MQVLPTIDELRAAKYQLCRRHAEETSSRPLVGLTPTMGNLHDGHLALIQRMQEESDLGVVSLFVNPTQFDVGEDYGEYPRTLGEDLAKCEEAGVQLVFAPDADELYEPDRSTEVLIGQLSEHYCGAARPGHFAGVALVVAKLFNIVQPDRAYFGQKDFQQFRVLERMVRDLDFPLEMVMCPTVREPDGLAMSSRNSYLSPEERSAAASIYAGLQALAAACRNGERRAEALKEVARAALSERAEIEYLEIADAWSLEPRELAEAGNVALVAVRVGRTRLIDNLLLETEETDAA